MVDPKLDTIRGCADHSQECVAWARPVLVQIIKRVWPGPALGQGSPATETVLFTLPRRDVRELSVREVISSGGRYQDGDLKVEDLVKPYTSHGGGGFSESDLRPVAEDKRTEIIYRLSGDITGDFALLDTDASDPVFVSITLRKWRR